MICHSRSEAGNHEYLTRYGPDPTGCVYFKISPDVIMIIRRLLVGKIMNPLGLVEKDPDYQLSLMITTGEDCRETLIKGPDNDRRNRYASMLLFLLHLGQIIRSKKNAKLRKNIPSRSIKFFDLRFSITNLRNDLC